MLSSSRLRPPQALQPLSPGALFPSSPQICCSPGPPFSCSVASANLPRPPIPLPPHLFLHRFPPSLPFSALPDCYSGQGRRPPALLWCGGSPSPVGPALQPLTPACRLHLAHSPTCTFFNRKKNPPPQKHGNDLAFIVEINKRMWGEGGGRTHPFIGGKCFNNFCWITLQLNKTDIVINKIFKN